MRARLAMYFLVAAMALGLAAMHSSLVAPDGDAGHAVAASAEPTAQHDESHMAMTDVAGALADCDPTALMCMALILALTVVLWLASRTIGPVLWQRPRFVVRLGHPTRPAFAAMPLLHQTSVLRC